jgi:hypothetical protein
MAHPVSPREVQRIFCNFGWWEDLWLKQNKDYFFWAL